MGPAVIAVLGGIIRATAAAQAIWQILQPILQAQRDPTAAEWAQLNALADQAHAEVQADA